MARVEVVNSLLKEIDKRFKQESIQVLQHLKSLESFPKKGKELGTVGGIIIKELRYRGFRFYFITDGFKIKCIDEASLVDLLLRFVRMSDKKYQRVAITEIKYILKTIGPAGFE